MISYVNPDNEQFERNISGEIYVDKTLLIEKLNSLVNTDNNKLCISRPRRFGKTMSANLISAYYSCGCDSRELFSNTKLAKTDGWDKYLNKFNVIKIDVQEIYSSINRYGKDLSEEIEKNINKDLKKQFPDITEIDITSPLAQNIISVYNATNRRFVMIMDEYDVLVREKRDDEVLTNYLSLLNALFKGSIISDAFALVYLTGIFPIIKDTFQSKLNNFREYSITKPGILAGYIGFTEDEVKELCSQYDMDFTECKNWYDGYKLGKKESIYNPCSVVLAMEEQEFSDYWSNTGSFESISNYIIHNVNGLHDDIKLMIDKNKKISVNISGFTNRLDNITTKDAILTYLIHIGYLTYDSENRECYIPNNEIREEWGNAIQEVPSMFHFYELFQSSKNIFESLIKKNCEKVCDNLDKIHHSSGDVNSYGNEAALHTSLVTAMTYSRAYYTVHNEASTGKGRSDIVFLPKNNYSHYPTLILELKVDESAETAMKQIHEKLYGYDFDPEYRNNMLLVGINYDKKNKKHECIIEKFQEN